MIPTKFKTSHSSIVKEFSRDQYDFDTLTEEVIQKVAAEHNVSMTLWEVYSDHPTKNDDPDWQVDKKGELDGAGDEGWWACVPDSLGAEFSKEFPNSYPHGHS